MAVEVMDHDDDVERLFSWLQTPDLRYREFAGAREVTDTVATWQILRKTGDSEVPLEAESVVAEPAVTAPIQPAVPEPPARRGPSTIAPVPQHPAAEAPAVERGLFALGAGGRAPAPHAAPPPTAAPATTAQVQPAVPSAKAQPQAGRLLGGAYGGSDDSGPEPAPPADDHQRSARSLDAVFSRLAGGRRQPDPRERLRHIPGLGPSADRSR